MFSSNETVSSTGFLLRVYCKISTYIRVKVRTYENTFNRECPNFEPGLSAEEYDTILDLCQVCGHGDPAVDRIETVNKHTIFCYSTSLLSEEEVCHGTLAEQVYCVDCQVKCIQYRNLSECPSCSQNSRLCGKLIPYGGPNEL